MGAFLFLGGAVGVESFEGRHVEEQGMENLSFSLYVFVQEGMEMIGILVFIRGLLGYLRSIL